MNEPSVVRVMVKDLVDFSLVFLVSFMGTLAIYRLLPSFSPVMLSIYFFEHYVDLFYVNPKLLVWFFGLGFGVNALYYFLCALLLKTTLGGFLVGLHPVKYGLVESIDLSQVFLMSLGSYLGAALLFIGPFWAWWLDPLHRGFSEHLARSSWTKKPKAFPKGA